MQLNIFEDSRDTELRNDVIRGIERRDGNLARAALIAEFPNDGAVPGLALLVQSLERWTDVPVRNT